MHNFSKMFKKDYPQTGDTDEAESFIQHPSKKRDVWRSLVGDAQKRTEKAETEAPGMLNDANGAKSLAQHLDTTGAPLREQDVDNLISQTDKVKHWIKENKKPLGLSQEGYEQMRKGYNASRDAWQRHRGTRTSYSDMAGTMAMGAAAMGGVGIPSAPYAGTMERSADEIEAMKRSVAREARGFLNTGAQHIQNLADPFSDRHAAEDQ